MNNERDKQASDDLVSATYREHSSERAPERLNQKILAMAADGSKKTKTITPLFGTRTRPLALAATIALSFAIVLEVTEVPQDVLGPVVPVAPSSDSVREEFTPKDNSSVEEARNQARLREGFNQEDSLVAEPQASSKLDTRQNTFATDAPAETPEAEIIPQVAAEPDTAGLSDADRPERAKRSLSSDFDRADEAVAEGVARPAAATFSMSAEKKESDANGRCSTVERASAKDWLACIEELRRSGATREAEREYEEYILTFPDE